MNKKHYLALFTSALLHVVYIIFSYNTEPLSSLSTLCDPSFIHRVLMLSQAFPLVITLSKKEPSENRGLLFLSFAIYINTLFVLNDFTGGFYCAMTNYESSVLPTQRITAHMVAFKETNHILILDPRVEFSHIFLCIFMLSEITSLHHILVFTIIIRATHIVLWALIGTLLCEEAWSEDTSIGFKRCLSLLLATSILLMAGGSYGEFGFTFQFFVLLTLLLIKFEHRRSRSMSIILLLFLIAALISTITVTIVIALTFLMAALLNFLRREPRHSMRYLLFSTAAIARIFVLGSPYRAKEYWTYLSDTFSSIWSILQGEIMIREELFTVGRKGMDRIIDTTTTFSMFSFLTLVTVLCFIGLYVRSKKNPNNLSAAVWLSYLIFHALNIAVFVASRTGILMLYDIGTYWFTFLLSPVAILMLRRDYNLPFKGSEKKIVAYALLALILILTVFAPFYAYKGNVKNLYDGLGVMDFNDYILFTNKLCRFVVSCTQSNQHIMIDPSIYPLLWHELLLRYQLNKSDSTLERMWGHSVNITSVNVIYDNIIYQVTMPANRKLVLASKIFGTEIFWSRQLRLGMIEFEDGLPNKVEE